MSTESEQTRLKQNYLKKQIIDNDYDPEEFADFLEKRRDNGTPSNDFEKRG